MRSILVPTDFSVCAQNAANAAIQIAVTFKASIHFLHIMPLKDELMHVPHVSQVAMQDQKKGHAQNGLNLLVSSATNLRLTATPMLVFDNGNERIENYINSFGIDLVVMGSHGATGIRELIIGSNTQRVVRNSPVPVLVIKQTISDQFKIENIVFASTFKEEFVLSFNQVAHIAKQWNAKVHILFINFIDKLVDQTAIDKIVKKITEPHPDIQFTTNTAEANDEEFGIHQFVEMISADLIALTTSDKTGFLVRHSVAEDLVNHENIPILVMK